MKYQIRLLATMLLMFNISFAQYAHFTTSGTVEYEKSVNTYAIIKRLYGNRMDGFLQQAFDQYKKTQPQFKILKSILTFAGSKSLYKPIAVENSTGMFFNIPMASQNNVIYTDAAVRTSVAQKSIFEETFLVKDTMPKIKWKITDETRIVAGYTCRRANGLMMDSIYVVAFYTDKIPLSVGPESFGGLPGMILEVALPHENVIWRATKVDDINISEPDIVPPKKGKVVNNKELYETLKSVFKNRGDGAQINLMIKSYLL